jgi:Zn-dependent protease with chaperone function
MSPSRECLDTTGVVNVNNQYAESLSPSDRIALWLMGRVGTMPFFWFCNVLPLLPVLWPQSLAVVTFVSSGWWQLAFLPLILVAQNVQSRHAELMADQHYAAEAKADAQIEMLMKEIRWQNKALAHILVRLCREKSDALVAECAEFDAKPDASA